VITKLEFILYYTIVLFFIMQITSMAGASLVSGVNAPTPPDPPHGALDTIGWVVGNIGYFFQLMGTSTTFTLFGTLILTPFLIVLIWIVIEIIRGVG
jgi:hypothetical protein